MTGIPNARSSERAGIAYEQERGGTTATTVLPIAESQRNMAFCGDRYGDPSLPRFATGRADGRVPRFPNASPDLEVGRTPAEFKAGDIVAARQPKKKDARF